MQSLYHLPSIVCIAYCVITGSVDDARNLTDSNSSIYRSEPEYNCRYCGDHTGQLTESVFLLHLTFEVNVALMIVHLISVHCNTTRNQTCNWMRRTLFGLVMGKNSRSNPFKPTIFTFYWTMMAAINFMK